MSTIACGLLLLATFAFVFYPQRHTARQRPKTRLDFLREQKDVSVRQSSRLEFRVQRGQIFGGRLLRRSAPVWKTKPPRCLRKLNSWSFPLVPCKYEIKPFGAQNCCAMSAGRCAVVRRGFRRHHHGYCHQWHYAHAGCWRQGHADCPRPEHAGDLARDDRCPGSLFDRFTRSGHASHSCRPPGRRIFPAGPAQYAQCECARSTMSLR